MSTHNIGFYEDLTKIIFELSSNIIKYAPYFFFGLEASNCLPLQKLMTSLTEWFGIFHLVPFRNLVYMVQT